jgi:hypothetical protein
MEAEEPKCLEPKRLYKSDAPTKGNKVHLFAQTKVYWVSRSSSRTQESKRSCREADLGEEANGSGGPSMYKLRYSKTDENGGSESCFPFDQHLLLPATRSTLPQLFSHPQRYDVVPYPPDPAVVAEDVPG